MVPTCCRTLGAWRACSYDRVPAYRRDDQMHRPSYRDHLDLDVHHRDRQSRHRDRPERHRHHRGRRHIRRHPHLGAARIHRRQDDRRHHRDVHLHHRGHPDGLDDRDDQDVSPASCPG